MPHFFIILFKINLVLVLFAAAYYFILRRLTFYVINRIFLLFGILFSTIYPFINLTEFFAKNKALPTFVPGLNQNVSDLIQFDVVSFFWQALSLIFYAGVIVMASRLMVQFISLRNVHKNSNPGIVNNNKVRILNTEVSPFSFWQAIYVNPDLHKAQDLKNIIEHEKVHVEEWHTIDIILAEISLVFYWFNPGVWLMKKAVRENIEFITDAKILKRGVDKKAYQYSLLDVGTLQPSVAIVNNFNLSDLKKRIRMMNAKRSSKVNLTRYVFVLPVLLLVTLAFTVDKKDVQNNIIAIAKVLKNQKVQKKTVNVSSLVPKQIVLKKVKSKSKRVDSVLNVVNIFRSIPLSSDSLKLAPNFEGKADLVLLDDKQLAKNDGFNSSLKGKVAGVRIENQKPDEIRDKKQVEVVVIGYGRKTGSQNPIVRLRGISTDSVKKSDDTSFIINGEAITRDKLSTIDPNSIKTITVIGKMLKR